ncbi:MAG: hypothetical protein R2724_06270 [Bryobacterales bacterium]
MVVIAEYPQDFLAVFTINYSAMKYEQRADQLNSYDGDKARMDIGREFLRSTRAPSSPAAPSIAKEQPGGFAGDHRSCGQLSRMRPHTEGTGRADRERIPRRADSAVGQHVAAAREEDSVGCGLEVVG